MKQGQIATSSSRILRRAFIGIAVWAGSASIALPASVRARPNESASPLTLAMSLEAVDEAVRVCGDKNYKVTVTVVDPDGIIKAQVRGDGSPIHSQRFSFRKAYTIVSMGPMFGVDTSSALVKFLGTYPSGISNVAGGTTDLLFVPGAVLIKSGNDTIGSIGVSGAPQSMEDEACAEAALAKIQPRLGRTE